MIGMTEETGNYLFQPKRYIYRECIKNSSQVSLVKTNIYRNKAYIETQGDRG